MEENTQYQDDRLPPHPSKPTLFIGSSTEGIKIAYAVQEELENDAETTVWSQGIFEPSKTVIESLLESLDSFDLGLFIFTPDDKVFIRDSKWRTARDNVLFELGLFIGRLGRERSFFLIPSDVEDFHIPGDLFGVTALQYQFGRIDGRNRSAVGPACNRLRTKITDLEAPQNTFKLHSAQKTLVSAMAKIAGGATGMNDPMINIIETWCHQIAEEIDRGSPKTFKISSSYYKECLFRLQRLEGIECRAIADLSVDYDNIEPFWEKRPSAAETRVDERIFLIEEREIFDDKRLTELFREVIEPHSRQYTVYLGCAPGDDARWLEDFSSAFGYHLLLISPDLTGGYSESRGVFYLEVIRDTRKYAIASEVYGRIRANSIKIEPDMSCHSFKRSWLKKHAIGIWKKEWSRRSTNRRSDDYFKDYDMHIRCWIPEYDHFIRNCASHVTSAALSIGNEREANSGLSILEIGFGTGSLTVLLLKWIRERIGMTKISLLGIDLAHSKMEHYLKKRLGSLLGCAEGFLFGFAWTGVPHEVSSKKFDVICSSLVFHDMVSDYRKEGGSFEAALFRIVEECDEYLAPEGVMLFADCFTESDPDRRREQREVWKKHMIFSGLHDDAAEFFLTENSDMIETINEEHLDALNSRGSHHAKLVPLTTHRLPFQMLEIRKILKSE